MADITWTDVTDYPGAAGLVAPAVPVAAQTLILSVVNDWHDVTLFRGGEDGDYVKLLRVLLAAHFAQLGLQADGTSPGALIGASEGEVSRQWASNSPMGTDPMLDKTTFGITYRNMITSSPARAVLVL